jgi:uncharacterized lipoprotein YmbA
VSESLRRCLRGAALLPAAGALLVAATIASCSVITPRADPSRFFVLAPLPDAASPAIGNHVSSLGVGPILLPRYLDRPEIVTRVGPNEVKPAVFDYWAGSLLHQFQTVLTQNLQTLVHADRVQTYPWYAGAAPELVVEVDVQRFEPSSDGRAELAARWRVRKGSALGTLRAGESSLTRPLNGREPEAAAVALSGLLDDFSRELAEAILAARA